MEQYKTIVAPVGFVIGKKGDYSASVQHYSSIIDREAVGGWKLHCIQKIPVTRKAGCVARLFGVQDSKQYFNMLVFKKSDGSSDRAALPTELFMTNAASETEAPASAAGRSSASDAVVEETPSFSAVVPEVSAEPEQCFTAEEETPSRAQSKRKLIIFCAVGAAVLLLLVLLLCGVFKGRPTSYAPVEYSGDVVRTPTQQTEQGLSWENDIESSGWEEEPLFEDHSAWLQIFTIQPSRASDEQGFIYYDYGRDSSDTWYSNSIGGYLPDQENWAEYDLYDDFNYFSGSAYLNYDYRDTPQQYAEIQIHGDGELLYSVSADALKAQADSFSIDISGIHTLRVSIWGNAQLRLSDCVLSEKMTDYSTASKATPDWIQQSSLGFIDYNGSLSELQAIPFSSAAATSELEYNERIYSVGNAIDDDLNTSWQEADDGEGIGESILLIFDEAQTVDVLRFRLGYAPYYENNNRPREMQIEFSDGSCFWYEFPDRNEDLYYELSEPVSTDSIRFTILSVYAGSKFNDTCITEIGAFRHRTLPSGADTSGLLNASEDSSYCGVLDLNAYTGSYVIQCGSFAEQVDAENYAHTVVAVANELGLSLPVFTAYLNGYYCPFVGPFAAKDDAETANLSFTSDGRISTLLRLLK